MAHVFTEIVGCGKIGRIALKSYCKHHPKLTVHVYGLEDDFKQIDLAENICYKSNC